VAEYDTDTVGVALCIIASSKCSSEIVSQAWIVIDNFLAAWDSETPGDPAHQRRWRELVAFRDWVGATLPESFTRFQDDVPMDFDNYLPDYWVGEW
jgi:hypothetical protein